MNDIQRRLAALGTGIPEILLPGSGVSLNKWAVIACDQFTQDMNYWEEVKSIVGGEPSSINMIFPEVYLEEESAEEKTERIINIRSSMETYLNEGIFAPPRRCCVYVERSAPEHPKRRGLVLTIDLEQYEWTQESRPLIRSTEGTVTERLPSRIEIRRGAPLEVPHIIVLLDDEEDLLIPSLGKIARQNPPLYETPLMINSGAVSGWALDTEDALALLAEGLEELADKSTKRYGSTGGQPFLFAVGDGNHSLAAAKAVWEEYKAANKNDPSLIENFENHPARWAMVEVENIYDPGIAFEPIHRVVFGAEPAELLEAISVIKDIRCIPGPPEKRVIYIENLSQGIVTASLEPLLDSFVKEKGYSIDYIHGEDEAFRLAASRRAVGLILPPVQKEGLFKTVAQTGPLPRKSFSMGEACDKRFYLECRRLY
ncbi:MAG: DUF1015 domain-containing protein [Treponema sp.]|nr:DUF1015 domain-containing protein [Treponema sp.]